MEPFKEIDILQKKCKQPHFCKLLKNRVYFIADQGTIPYLEMESG